MKAKKSWWANVSKLYSRSSSTADNPNYTPQASFSYGFEPVGPRYPAPTPSQWVVAAGDTLQSITQSVYGNSKLWFLIAEANGLTDPSDLSSIQGQSLTLPARVTGSLNDAGSSKPYDPSTVRGASAPELPMPSAGSGGGCGGFGQVITAAVAIAVTFATQGAAASLWAGFLGAGSTASSLGLATAAAIGSVASQATGNALGVQQGFSWNAVALSALSAGITRGVVGDSAAAAASSSWQNTAVQYAAANALTQSFGVVTGLQRSFDWRGVVASAAGSVTGQLSGHGLNQSNAFASWGDWGGQLARATTSGLAAGTTAAVMRGGRVSVQQVASDAFGNALGSSLAGLSSGVQVASSADPLGDFIDRNMPAWERRQAHFDQVTAAFSQPGSPERSQDLILAAGDGFSLGRGSVQNRGVHILPDDTRQLILDATGSAAVDSSGDRWTPYGPTPQEGGTVTGSRMTPQEMAEFDLLNPGLADAERIKSFGSISANPPPIWERVLLDQDVRRVMGNSMTGKVFDAFLNSAGNIGAAFVSPIGYNFASGQHLNPVQRREARIDAVIDWATAPLLGVAGAVRGSSGVGGGRSALISEAHARSASVTRRMALDAKFGRSGNLDLDINARGVASSRNEVDRLVREGHAIGRHGERVTELALDNRALHKFDPITGKTTDYFTRGTHNVGRNATHFTTNEALLSAERYTRDSPQYLAAYSDAMINSLDGFAIKGLPLEQALGPNYKSQVFGKARVGSVGNPTGTQKINFTDGTLTAIFKKSPSGNWNLHTIYPEPK